MGKFKVNEGTQVFIGDKRYVGGETFTATDAELDEFGSRDYVTEAREKAAESKPAAKAENKAQAPPQADEAKAENKAQAAPKPQSK